LNPNQSGGPASKILFPNSIRQVTDCSSGEDKFLDELASALQYTLASTNTFTRPTEGDIGEAE
jgi:hypothetical protein